MSARSPRCSAQVIVIGACIENRSSLRPCRRCAVPLSAAARSAFKLLQIQRAFDIFRDVRSVVDLCAAPGGWTEVLSQQLAGQTASASALVAAAAADASATVAGAAASSSGLPPVRIVAVDLQAMAPLPGVHFIQGDLTRAVTATLILDALGRDDCDGDDSASPMDTDAGAAGSVSSVACSAAIPAPSSSTSATSRGSQRLAELVVCDGAPDVIGMHDVDESVQHELTLSALNIALHILRPCAPIEESASAAASTSSSDAAAATGTAAAASLDPPLQGCFVAKLFRGRRVSLMYALMQKYFHRVSISKPKSCRTTSVEGFVVCQGYRGLSAVGEEARTMDDALQMCEAEGLPLKPVPFVSCWDEEKLDSDMSYPLSYTFHALRGDDIGGGGGGRGGTNTAGAAPSSAAGPVAAAPTGYQHLAPSAMPIDPPYMRSLQIKRQNNKVQ